jgi:hypothetical protein
MTFRAVYNTENGCDNQLSVQNVRPTPKFRRRYFYYNYVVLQKQHSSNYIKHAVTSITEITHQNTARWLNLHSAVTPIPKCHMNQSPIFRRDGLIKRCNRSQSLQLISPFSP